MRDHRPTPAEPLDVHGVAQRHWWLRMMLTGASTGGDAASAVYGTILAASILIASQGGALSIFLAVVGTGIVFWLAHAHVAIMRKVVRGGQHVGVTEVRHALTEEWPLVQASISPALPLLLAMTGVISAAVAADLGIVICFAGLIAWGIVVSRAANLDRRQTTTAVAVNVGLGLLLVTLKTIVH